MPDASQYEYPSPLEGYEHLPALPDEKAEDGKSYVNPQNGVLSKAYENFVDPIDNGVRGGFDVHLYYYQENKAQTRFAHELWTRIRHEFPELRIYRVWDRPVGPHPIAMFEVNIFTPAQFGAFIAWLVINRGPLSVLVHPNTGDDEVSNIETYNLYKHPQLLAEDDGTLTREFAEGSYSESDVDGRTSPFGFKHVQACEVTIKVVGGIIIG